MVSIRSVFIWALLNWAILGFGAVGFPVWAHHPFPRESIAFYELICAQTVLISLFFPLLAATRWTLAINFSLMLPVDELGGLLSNLGQGAVLRCYGCVGIWLLGLGVGAWMVKRERIHLLIICAASCFTLGGAILDYLRWEISTASGESNGFTPLSLLPSLCGLAANSSSIAWAEAALPATIAVIGIVIKATFRTPSTSLHNPA
jgi:hypothetical protein